MLKDQIRASNDRTELDRQLEHDGYVHWRNHTDGKRRGPYCAACWKKEGVLFPLTHIPGAWGDKCKRFDYVTHGPFNIPTGELDVNYGRPQTYQGGGGREI